MTSKPASLDGILLILDDQQEAQEIAAELRRNGQQVLVREIPSTPGQPPSLQTALPLT
jgi:hypothetical protein